MYLAGAWKASQKNKEDNDIVISTKGEDIVAEEAPKDDKKKSKKRKEK